MRKKPVSPGRSAPALALLLSLSTAAAAGATCVTRPAGLTAWYPLDETSGTVAHDIQLNHDGTYHGSTATPGYVAGARDFNGTTDYVAVADHPDLDLGTGDFSIDAWIRTTDLFGMIAGKRAMPLLRATCSWSTTAGCSCR